MVAKSLFDKRPSIIVQCITTVLMIVLVSFICKVLGEFISYKSVALILLMSVSVLAAVFEIIPVMLAALISAVIWNFYFIPPTMTFHIDTTEDVLMFLMYFVVAFVNAVLTNKIRQQKKKNRDKEEKEKTIALYDTLLNSLSHELRTPISTIIGAVDTLQESKKHLSEQNASELLSQINTASLRLNEQVENLLNMSRIESGMIVITPDWTDVNELIFHVIHSLKDQVSNHILEFTPDPDLPLAKIDGILVTQAIYNIVQNAVAYTHPGSVIRISATIKSDQILITIADNGKGFTADEVPKAFNKFFRATGSVSSGTGLGLSISKGLIEAHKGSIVLTSQENHGARFDIILPVPLSFIHKLKNE